MRGVKTEDDIYSLFKIVDKLEKRIATLEKVIGKLQLKVGDVVLYIDNNLERKQWAILNYVKAPIVILIIHKIELKELKAVRQIKLEEDHHYIGESSATIDVITIGLENMERGLLITSEDWQNQNI